MVESDLYTPLQGRPRRRRRHGGRSLAVYGTVLLIVGGATIFALHDDGRRGEPFAVGSIDITAAKEPIRANPPAPSQPSPVASPPVDANAEVDARAGRQVAMENGVMVIRATGLSTTTPVSLKVSDPIVRRAALALPDPQLIESSATGPLPRIGRDGRTPASLYAGTPVAANGKPRVALVLGGMGLDRMATAQASAQLPAAVTFGFAPYGERIAEQVAQTRASGHEVILQMPMEDFGRDDRPFPHMLMAGAGDNTDRLHWLLSRFSGYAGVGNYLGGRLMADEDSLKPLLREIAARGLYFLDDGTASRSLAMPLAHDVALPAMKADVVIDAEADGASVVAAMVKLEKIARERGFALGSATGRPATNVAIGRYLEEAGKRGLVVVPLGQALNAGVASADAKAP